LPTSTEKALAEHKIIIGHTTSSVPQPPTNHLNYSVESSEVSYTSQSTQTDESSFLSAKSLLATGMSYAYRQHLIVMLHQSAVLVKDDNNVPNTVNM